MDHYNFALLLLLNKLFCLIYLYTSQEPLYLNVIGTIKLSGTPIYKAHAHIFEKYWKRKSRSAHLMENSLNRLSYIPSASVFDRYLDFGTGSATNLTMNISKTLCVTNHGQINGCIQWLSGYIIFLLLIKFTLVINYY